MKPLHQAAYYVQTEHFFVRFDANGRPQCLVDLTDIPPDRPSNTVRFGEKDLRRMIQLTLLLAVGLSPFVWAVLGALKKADKPGTLMDLAIIASLIALWYKFFHESSGKRQYKDIPRGLAMKMERTVRAIERGDAAVLRLVKDYRQDAAQDFEQAVSLHGTGS